MVPEKPPPEWGVLCEQPFDGSTLDAPGRNPHRSGEARAWVRISLVVGSEKPPPKWGGLCEVMVALALAWWLSEKPPPEWGGICDGPKQETLIVGIWDKPPPGWSVLSIPTSAKLRYSINPHRSGEVFA
jgi:hypothetical protein